ncbi:type II toxin-antitoxin system RelE/ParE family toxin [archaeon SCG-AAA382B04]|nr:type II toxin-antitoxin system RelE/ParE family toxin [archaeon SCG-AAA382B04]
MEVRIHPRVVDYIEEVGEKERIKEKLENLKENPYKSRSGADIKKLKSKENEMYRLRIRPHRFEYLVEEGVVWVENAFRRGRGYR